MANITKKELDELKASGAEIEIEPQVLVIDGLINQLSKLEPKHVDLSEVVSSLQDIVRNINRELTVKCEPVVESIHHSHNNNEILIDTKSIIEAIDRLKTRNEYRFIINRDARGRIESMDARLMEEGL